MTEEEQEAIEKFRYGSPLNYQTVIRKIKHDKITDVAVTRKKYIDTTLNYIEKLQKENDTLKTTINKQSKDISEQLKELDKKDKAIDLMADKLFRHGFFVVEPVKKYDVESELYIKSKTKEEIKEYFYKKVEGEK